MALDEVWLLQGEIPDLLAELLYPPEWQRDAVLQRVPPGQLRCRERGESIEPAKAIGSRCLVAAECLAYAIQHDEQHGVWGGSSPKARQALRRTQRAA